MRFLREEVGSAVGFGAWTFVEGKKTPAATTALGLRLSVVAAVLFVELGIDFEKARGESQRDVATSVLAMVAPLTADVCRDAALGLDDAGVSKGLGDAREVDGFAALDALPAPVDVAHLRRDLMKRDDEGRAIELSAPVLDVAGPLAKPTQREQAAIERERVYGEARRRHARMPGLTGTA